MGEKVWISQAFRENSEGPIIRLFSFVGRFGQIDTRETCWTDWGKTSNYSSHRQVDGQQSIFSSGKTVNSIHPKGGLAGGLTKHRRLLLVRQAKKRFNRCPLIRTVFPAAFYALRL